MTLNSHALNLNNLYGTRKQMAQIKRRSNRLEHYLGTSIGHYKVNVMNTYNGMHTSLY